MLNALLNFFVPAQCVCCYSFIGKNEKFVCPACSVEFAETDYWVHDENEAAKQLWGRVNVNALCAHYYYGKHFKIAGLLHHMKYGNGQDACEQYGRILGQKCLEHRVLATADVVVPVPMHTKKLKVRGYNQSALLGRGIAAVTKWPVETGLLLKPIGTDSQTRKGRKERARNALESYGCANSHTLSKDSHILLVDDILTTGATLEGCITALNCAGYHNISAVVLAYTNTN